MADRQTHLDIAIGIGLVAGLISAKAESVSAFLAEVGGVVAGSALGGVLPDILEPATSSWHRKSFHSVAALVGSSSLTVKPPIGVIGWRESLRKEGTRYREQREALPANDPRRGELWLAEVSRHFLAGASVGLPVGYASHLFEDGKSPRGLPLL